jgi:hypothetical protein
MVPPFMETPIWFYSAQFIGRDTGKIWCIVEGVLKSDPQKSWMVYFMFNLFYFLENPI